MRPAAFPAGLPACTKLPEALSGTKLMGLSGGKERPDRVRRPLRRPVRHVSSKKGLFRISLNPRSNRSAGLWGRFRGGAGRSSVPGMLRASGLRSASAAAWRSSFRIRSGTSPGSSRTPRTNTQMRRLRPSQSMQACLHQPTSACSQAVSNRMPAPGCRPLRRGVPQAGRPVASPMNAAEIPASGYCCNQRRLAPVALSHCRLTRSSMEQPLGHGLWKVPRGHTCVDTNPIPGPNAGTGWRREDLRPS